MSTLSSLFCSVVVLVVLPLVCWWWQSTQDKHKKQAQVDRVNLVARLHNTANASATVHLILVVPGLLSPPEGLEQLRLALIQQANVSGSSGSASNTKSKGAVEIVIHRCTSNLGWDTRQGVLVCGQRLAVEVNGLLKDIAQAQPIKKNKVAVTLSFLGNSLGGLIARAALPDIQWQWESSESHSDSHSPQFPFTVIPRLFVTTNSPHLGSKDALYIHWDIGWLERLLMGLAQFLLGPTGRDLFRANDTLTKLATHKRYLQPLGQFHKRMAFTNAFGTDCQVPPPTAVFIASQSDSPHTLVPHFEREFPLVVHAVTTTRQQTETRTYTTGAGIGIDTSKDNQENYNATRDGASSGDWGKVHSQHLDQLGWTKVFCDPRPVLPKLPIPVLSWNRFSNTNHNHVNNDNTRKKSDANRRAKEKWTADQLYQYYYKDTAPPLSSSSSSMTTDAPLVPPLIQLRWVPIPVAHKVLLANSARLPLAQHFTDRGLPFVHEFAKRVVRTVLDCQSHDATTKNNNIEMNNMP